MSELPTHGLLQQLNARPVSGEHLEVLGKKAAALWGEGQYSNLNEAVVAIVKHAGLSPEQVKRVVEFTNTEAYLADFRKEGSPHKVVQWQSGLADSAVVLQDLNDGGGGSTFDTGSGDYSVPPSGTKTASAQTEAAFERMFKSSGFEYPEENPLGEALDLRDKLSSVLETATSELSSLEVQFGDLKERLFHHVKQAALAGTSLADVAQIWGERAPSDDHVKVAFAAIIDPLVDNGVFRTHVDLVESLEKRASGQLVNESHPLVTDFTDFCDTLSKLAETRSVQREAGEGVARLTDFLKSADGGMFQRANEGLSWLSQKANHGGTAVGNALLGNEYGKHLGTAAELGTHYVLPALAANEVYRRTLKHNPAFQKAKGAVLSATPGTQEYYNKEYELAARAGGYPMG